MIQHQKRNFKLYGRYIEYWTIGENDKYQVWPDAKKEDTGISKMPAIPEEMEHELDDLVKFSAMLSHTIVILLSLIE